MGTLIGAIISAMIPIGVASTIVIGAGYWLIKSAVRKGIIEAYREISKEKAKQED